LKIIRHIKLLTNTTLYKKVTFFSHLNYIQTMSTVFETRLIGNIGRDAVSKTMNKGVIALNFPVAHNKNWKDKRTGQLRTNTTWINCTIWKHEKSNLRIADYLKRGTLVEITGVPIAKAFQNEDGSLRTEIRLNVIKINILRSSTTQNTENNSMHEHAIVDTDTTEDLDTTLSEFSIEDYDF